MSFFNDKDPFENLIERMFGGNGNFTEYSAESDGKRVYKRSGGISDNFIDTKKFVYFVLDLSSKQNVSINIKEGTVRNRFGEQVRNGHKVIEIKTNDGEIFEYVIPEELAKKKYNWKFKNGILEVIFKK